MLGALKNKMVAGLLLPTVFVAGSLGGCVKSMPKTDLPASEAWKQMRAQDDFAKLIGSLTDGDVTLTANATEMAEEASKEATTPVEALNEIVDDVSKELSIQLPAYAKKSGTEWRLTLAAGTLIDRTADQKLGSAMDLIARRLQSNAQFTRHFKVLSSTASDAEAIIKDLSGSHPDDIYLPDSDQDTSVAKVHPDDLYLMTGWTDVFFEEGKRKMKTVTFIDVQHPQKREVVMSKEFSRTYYFHPYLERYITEDEEQRRVDALAAFENENN